MRAATRALAVLVLGGAFALSSAPAALAAPCPPGTYPPGQDCTISEDGTTGGSTPGPVVIASPGAVSQPTPAPTVSPAPVGGSSAADSSDDGLGMTPVAYGIATGILVLALGLALLLVLRRRQTGDTSEV